MMRKHPDSESECATTFVLIAFVAHLKEPITSIWPRLKKNVYLGLETGDVLYSGYSHYNGIIFMFFAGEKLETLRKEHETAHALLKKNKQLNSLYWNLMRWEMVEALMDPSPARSLSGTICDFSEAAAVFKQANDSLGTFYGHFVPALYYFHLGEYERADLEFQAAFKQEQACMAVIDQPMLYFYGCLCLLQLQKTRRRVIHAIRLKVMLFKIKKWARSAPSNYEHLYQLILAELAQSRGAMDKARVHYREAVQAAEKIEHMKDLALIYELYAGFWLRIGERTIADQYLSRATEYYGFWGAKAKVTRLKDVKTTHAATEGTARGQFSVTRHIGMNDLDFESLIRSAQVLSKARNHEQLLGDLLRITLENAGATKGMFILRDKSSNQLYSYATIEEQDRRLDFTRVSLVTSDALPRAIIQYVANTKTSVLEGRVAGKELYAFDPYIIKNAVKSVLAIPIVARTELEGILYVENTLVERAFDHRHVRILSVLGAQAMISLENADLYLNMELKIKEQTADIRSMMANIKQGIFMISPELEVYPEFSGHLSDILGGDPLVKCSGLAFLSDTGLSVDALETTKAVLNTKSELEYSANQWLLPREVTYQGKILEVDWNPILDETGGVHKVLVSLRDVTKLRQLEAEARHQRREHDVIGSFMVLARERTNIGLYLDNLASLIAEANGIVATCHDIQPGTITAVLRHVHTVKGNARFLTPGDLAEAAHSFESYCEDLAHQGLQPTKEDLLKQLSVLEGHLGFFRQVFATFSSLATPDESKGDASFMETAYDFIRNPTADLTRAMREQLARRYCETPSELVKSMEADWQALAKDLGKEPPVLEVQGRDLALSQKASSLLRNVFGHLIRNSLDHGIEAAEERGKKGKQVRGRIQITFQPEQKTLVIQVADDGKGLHLHKLRTIAEEQHLLTSDELTDPQAVARLIFRPTISTNDAVSLVSGRGIGLDDVKDLIEKHQGSIAIALDQTEREAGYRGFTLKICLPLDEFVVSGNMNGRA
jgi:GAF domain-containing protein/HPt (histidine-containing phosphotransfer) domain-containing protein